MESLSLFSGAGAEAMKHQNCLKCSFMTLYDPISVDISAMSAQTWCLCMFFWPPHVLWASLWLSHLRLTWTINLMILGDVTFQSEQRSFFSACSWTESQLEWCSDGARTHPALNIWVWIRGIWDWKTTKVVVYIYKVISKFMEFWMRTYQCFWTCPTSLTENNNNNK